MEMFKAIPRITSTVASATEVQDCVLDNSTDVEITIHARQLVFENTVFSVYADHVAGNNENEVTVDLDGCIEDNAQGELRHGEMVFHDLEGFCSLMDECEIEDGTTLCVLFKHSQIVAKPDTTLGLANIDRVGVTIEKP